MFRYEIRRMSGAYAIIFFLIFVLCYFSDKSLMRLIEPFDKGITDAIYRMFQPPFLSMIIAPMFAVVNLGLALREKDGSYITRFRSRADYWAKIVFQLVQHSFFYAVAVVAVCLLAAALTIPWTNEWTLESGFVFYNVQNTMLEEVWKSESWRFSVSVVVVMAILTGWMTFLAAGITVHVVSMLLNSKILALGLLVLIAICDTYLSFVSIIFRYSFFYLTYWFDWISYFISVFYLIIFNLILYLIGGYIVKRRDYLALHRWNAEE